MTYMKIHLHPAIPCVPLSLIIPYAMIFPKADTVRLITYHQAILLRISKSDATRGNTIPKNKKLLLRDSSERLTFVELHSADTKS
jgi:hypothetical protein